MTKKYMIFAVGAPGAGKSTLCRRWCDEIGFKHLSIEDHLCSILKMETNIFEQHIRERIENSMLLDSKDLFPILSIAVEDSPKIVIDGFPRTLHQAKEAGEVLGVPDLVIDFDCPHDLALERYMSRALPGPDQDPGIFGKRYNEYAELNGPIVREYEQRGILVRID